MDRKNAKRNSFENYDNGADNAFGEVNLNQQEDNSMEESIENNPKRDSHEDIENNSIDIKVSGEMESINYSGESSKFIDASASLKKTVIKRKLRDFCCQYVLKSENIFLFATVLCVLIGLFVGVMISIFANHPIDKETLEILHFPGELLLRALNCVLVPLIISSMITSVTSLGNIRQQGRIGSLTAIFYTSTTVIAVLLGIVLVLFIQPGRRGYMPPIDPNTNATFTDMIYDLSQTVTKSEGNSTGETLGPYCEKMKQGDTNQNTKFGFVIMKLIRNMIPQNMFDTMSYEIDCGVNILGIIAFGVTIGLIMTSMESEKVKPLLDVTRSVNDVTLKLVSVIICFAPIGIMFLIIWRFGKEPGPELWKILSSLGWYLLTVMTGLTIHLVFILPLLYLIFVRKNPLHHLKGMSSALLTAFGTSSSSATIPVTLQACENNLNLEKRVTRFVIPFGATINMDGTALYEAVAAIYIAQNLGYSLNIGQYLTVALTAVLASIGAAGIPEAGLITLIMVVESVGLPPDSIGVILAIDWFLDRFRTATNVWGDSIAASVVHHWTMEKKKKPKEKEMEINMKDDETSASHQEDITNCLEANNLEGKDETR